VGTALASLIEVPFLDSDKEIEDAANFSVAEIFESFGEEFFRQKETLVLSRLVTGAPCVLSTGGGSFLRRENRDLIRKHGIAVWLKADPELLWARVRHKTTRPLLQVADPYAKLMSLYQERLPSYRQAGLTVDADANYSIQKMAEKVADDLVNKAGHVLSEVS